MAALFLLATAIRWLASGCPLGWPIGSCVTKVGGLDVVASSDHLLTNIGLRTSGNSVILNVEGRSVVIRNGELLIEGAVECLIPPGSRHVEFAATGDVLRIMVDGKIIREAR
ncbi:MAG: hypothetical protein U0790_18760 [Isosphaeraceae bacterium]